MKPTIQVQNLADIKLIIRRRRRWGPEQRIKVLKNARVKLLAMRLRGAITLAEFRQTNTGLAQGIAEARAVWDSRSSQPTQTMTKSTPPGR